MPLCDSTGSSLHDTRRDEFATGQIVMFLQEKKINKTKDQRRN